MRISDWSSDVCSSDLCTARSGCTSPISRTACRPPASSPPTRRPTDKPEKTMGSDMNRPTKARWARRSSSLALILAAALAPPAFAQEEAPADAAAADPAAEGAIIVTGSRIARETYDTAAPTVSITSDDLLESGNSELSETLADLPQLSSTLNDSTVTGNTQNSGLSSIQLRNLGDNRTLVLIDGRRTVSNSAIGNRVSLSTIPSDFIDRVERSEEHTSELQSLMRI